MSVYGQDYSLRLTYEGVHLSEVSAQLLHIFVISGALVIDVILYKVYVMDTLSLHLDMSCKGIENWRHLANLNDVSTDLQLKFQAGERHCIAEKMFEVLAATDPDLLVGTLKQHLEDLKINNVVLYIRNLNLDGKCCISFLKACTMS